jgi:hypothetical protein
VTTFAHGRRVFHFSPPKTAREVISWRTGGLDRLLYDDGASAHDALTFAARYTIGVDVMSGHLSTPIGEWRAWDERQRTVALSRWLGHGGAIYEYIAQILAPCVLPKAILDEITAHMTVWTVDGGCSCPICRGERDDISRQAANCAFKGTSDRAWSLIGATASAIEEITLDDSYAMHQIRCCWATAKAAQIKHQQHKRKERETSHDMLRSAGLMK